MQSIFNVFKKRENSFENDNFKIFVSRKKKCWYHKIMKMPNFNYYNHTYYDLIEMNEILCL